MPSSSLADTIKHDNFIHKWLRSRQEWIVLFNQLCHLRPFEQSACDDEVKEQLTEFCILLMDYISLGHFRVFEKVLSTTSVCEDPQASVSQQLIDSLFKTTHLALDFNDKYQFSEDLSQLEDDLSQLGESIAKRFEWEDQLVKKYALAKNQVTYRQTA